MLLQPRFCVPRTVAGRDAVSFDLGDELELRGEHDAHRRLALLDGGHQVILGTREDGLGKNLPRQRRDLAFLGGHELIVRYRTLVRYHSMQ